MSTVKIPFDNSKEQAVLLLAAAAELDLPADVVDTTLGAFIVDEEVAKKAGLSKDAVDPDAPVEEPAAEEPKAPAKKAAAKKTAAKKAPAKSKKK